jgi:hypothetical protein
MKKQDFEKYINNFYDINPDNLEDEYIKVVKAFYIFSNLTSEAYADQLVAKDNVKKLSGMAFIQAKKNGDTDKKAEAKVNADPIVVKARSDYIEKIRKWEEYKGHKETTMLKKEMLVSLGFNRKTDLNVTEHS